MSRPSRGAGAGAGGRGAGAGAGSGPLGRLLAQHELELIALTDRETRAVGRALRDSERELLAYLVAEGGAGLAAEGGGLAAMANRLRTVRLGLLARLRGVLDPAAGRAVSLAGGHLRQLAAAGGPAVLGESTWLGVLAVLTGRQNLLLHEFSVDAYSRRTMDRIQGALVSGVVQGEPQGAIVARVRAVLPVGRREAELIVRMELSRAYSTANGAVVASLYEQDRGWRKRISETIDSANHPFSRVADGRMARPGERFRVPVAQVDVEARAMKRSAGGVLWQQVNGEYRGMTLPAHYGERGRVVPWHTDWAE